MQSWWLRLNEVQLYFINISKINDAVELKKMFKWHRWTQCDWTSSLKEQLHLSYMGVLCLFVCTWFMKKTHNTTVKSKKFMWYKLCAYVSFADSFGGNACRPICHVLLIVLKGRLDSNDFVKFIGKKMLYVMLKIRPPQICLCSQYL